MVKKSSAVLNFVAWLTGILVSLAVGFGMIGGTLIIPFIPSMITVIAGYVVVITTGISVILAILKQ